MTATVGTAAGDPRLYVEDDLAGQLGIEKVMAVRLREHEYEFAYATMWRAGSEPQAVEIRLTEADCRAAASAFDRIADEMGKRAAEAR